LSADAALKATGVRLLELRLATGLGGKAYYVLGGPLHLIEEAAETAGTACGAQLVNVELIANPDPDTAERLP
jgi:microcompartment protein CcmL/EutN